LNREKGPVVCGKGVTPWLLDSLVAVAIKRKPKRVGSDRVFGTRFGGKSSNSSCHKEQQVGRTCEKSGTTAVKKGGGGKYKFLENRLKAKVTDHHHISSRLEGQHETQKGKRNHENATDKAQQFKPLVSEKTQ